MKVLVTGATGFVGRPLLRRLQAEGHQIMAAYHRAPPIELAGVRWFRLENLAAKQATAASIPPGTETVVHLAALAHRPSRSHALDEMIRINRDATGALAEAAAAAGVRRFVFLSSVKASAESSGDRPLREDDPKRPAEAYGMAKSAAEERLGRIAANSGMESCVIRPPLVYGPGVRANFLSLMRWIDRGMWLPVGALDNLRSFVYVENLAHAICQCAGQPGAAGRTYFVSDGEDISTAELATRIARSLGRPVRQLAISPKWMRPAAKLLGREAVIDRIAGSLVVDTSRIRSELRWNPPYSMEAGLRATVEWYRAAQQSSQALRDV